MSSRKIVATLSSGSVSRMCLHHTCERVFLSWIFATLWVTIVDVYCAEFCIFECCVFIRNQYFILGNALVLAHFSTEAFNLGYQFVQALLLYFSVYVLQLTVSPFNFSIIFLTTCNVTFLYKVKCTTILLYSFALRAFSSDECPESHKVQIFFNVFSFIFRFYDKFKLWNLSEGWISYFSKWIVISSNTIYFIWFRNVTTKFLGLFQDALSVLCICLRVRHSETLGFNAHWCFCAGSLIYLLTLTWLFFQMNFRSFLIIKNPVFGNFIEIA